ncbi:hypothetical protein BMT54_06475 [Pasteurellaceae bacterium 15-036681]|nr:hypothetical protein BMT54_06475 [Pasteurellaceae bacterium 15-036681]
MQIFLDEVKQQCRVDHDDEDELLQIQLESAKSTIAELTNRILFETMPENPPDNALEITADLKLAVLMLTAYLYENRSGWNEANNSPNFAIPPTVEAIIMRYRYITL